MVYTIEAGHIGEEGLSCADVGGCLLSSDVLLPSLKGHTIASLVVSVNRSPDDPSWDLSDVLQLGCEEPGVGASESHRNAESLG